ncbi:MAG: hypothetical protein WBO55_19390 [Rhizobiaceae bacterium]
MTADGQPVSLRKLQLILWPFVTAAVAINLFLLFLLFDSFGMEPLSPLASLGWAGILGFPATWAAARWVRHLIDIAEGRKKG